MNAMLVVAGLLATAFGGIGAGFAQVATAHPADSVKVGGETKTTLARVKELQSGDAACYMVMTDRDGREFTEAADFDICSQEPSLIGRDVRLAYKLARVLAASCGGNPDCRKTERVALVVSARPVASASAGARVIPRTAPPQANATQAPPPAR